MNAEFHKLIFSRVYLARNKHVMHSPSEIMDYLSQSEDGVVIGPTVDGGYYAIGLKAPCRRLFEDIDWSTDRVFEQTRARVTELAMQEMILPVWYDVDDRFGLQRLLEDLNQEAGLGHRL